jgi:hypothetical protein
LISHIVFYPILSHHIMSHFEYMILFPTFVTFKGQLDPLASAGKVKRFHGRGQAQPALVSKAVKLTLYYILVIM